MALLLIGLVKKRLLQKLVVICRLRAQSHVKRRFCRAAVRENYVTRFPQHHLKIFLLPTDHLHHCQALDFITWLSLLADPVHNAIAGKAKVMQQLNEQLRAHMMLCSFERKICNISSKLENSLLN